MDYQKKKAIGLESIFPHLQTTNPMRNTWIFLVAVAGEMDEARWPDALREILKKQAPRKCRENPKHLQGGMGG